MRELVIASGNRGKVAEIASLLNGLGVRVSSLNDHFNPVPHIEETGSTFEENALIKAQWVSDRVDALVLADDSGLEVDALGGAPGVFSARYGGEQARDDQNVTKLLDALKKVPPPQRSARFRCVLVLLERGKAPLYVHGVCDGVIAAAPAGEGGFGYDPVFIPAGFHTTFAQMAPAVKDAISHRGKAVLHLRKELVRLYGRPLA